MGKKTPKLCPLKMMGTPEGININEMVCAKGDCAWWIQHRNDGECLIHSMAFELSEIRNQLTAR